MVINIETDNKNYLYAKHYRLYDENNNNVSIEDILNASIVFYKNKSELAFIKCLLIDHVGRKEVKKIIFKKYNEQLEKKAYIVKPNIKIKSFKEDLIKFNKIKASSKNIDINNHLSLQDNKNFISKEVLKILQHNNFDITKPSSLDLIIDNVSYWEHAKSNIRRMYINTNKGSLYLDINKGVFYENEKENKKNKDGDSNIETFDLEGAKRKVIEEFSLTQENIKEINEEKVKEFTSILQNKKETI